MSNERIEGKIDKISEDLTEIKITLATNTASLVEHIRRTNLLEDEIKPIKKHVVQVQGVLRFIGLVSLLVTIAVGFKKLIG